ncbi:hypothetical protein M2302_000592 [Micromonospora sp. A200]|uniref:hypothetical protein n=1 Tax=Micromonospora sp. A200 TaxID=2940568 RepID=UPI0024747E96|nr:hypothetical protein [Micromonospora sp. A200]MDH6460437.1 hypothetical protein [Micromonospora sp. A200]
MSVIRGGDERFHYSDGSHRWIPPDPDDDQEAWEAMVRQHQERHLDELRSRKKGPRTPRPSG